MEYSYVNYVQTNVIDENLKKNEYIEDAVSVVLDGTALIALQVKPMYSRLYKQKFIDTITSEIKKRSNINEVLITFDPDLFYKVSKYQNSQDKEAIRDLINIARKRCS